ncbi:hypothetical protein BCR33DRAFT_842425 [Rhizoclosmatium globosum]|uniref:Uncharacterized protein n=1 Tax=Rhizoclosmatium globosum TaxID=329046 RepID=A0A1Y2B4K9_9FUNG|nr:hypothetical protein BCR33DRAFT_842425 [Rhizoclosmatium globosum]|eukprot:ORY29417.1 hypothetical protein BCR33DRAFT_842425 [Rhizoclosmatium globosum]
MSCKAISSVEHSPFQFLCLQIRHVIDGPHGTIRLTRPTWKQHPITIAEHVEGATVAIVVVVVGFDAGLVRTKSTSRRPSVTAAVPTAGVSRTRLGLAPLVLQKEIVLVTSKGTFVVKAGVESTIDWALEVAADLMLAASSYSYSSGEEQRVVLVAARTGNGVVAHEDALVFEVCKQDKILYAITEDEVAAIPPSFIHAFTANPVTQDELNRARRLNPDRYRDSGDGVDPDSENDAAFQEIATTPATPLTPSSASNRRSARSMNRFSSRIRMSAMANHVQDLDSLVAALEKKKEAAEAADLNSAATQRTSSPTPLDRSDSSSSIVSVSSVTSATTLAPSSASAFVVLNPFGSQSESDVVVESSWDVSSTSSSSTVAEESKLAPANAGKDLSKRLTRASVFSMIMDVLPSVPSISLTDAQVATPFSSTRKTLQLANPDSISDEEPEVDEEAVEVAMRFTSPEPEPEPEPEPVLPPSIPMPAIPLPPGKQRRPSSIPVVPGWLAESDVKALAAIVPPAVESIQEEESEVTAASLPPPPPPPPPPPMALTLLVVSLVWPSPSSSTTSSNGFNAVWRSSPPLLLLPNDVLTQLWRTSAATASTYGSIILWRATTPSSTSRQWSANATSPPGAPAQAYTPPKPTGDFQADLMNALKDPNLRNRLKKRAPRSRSLLSLNPRLLRTHG